MLFNRRNFFKALSSAVVGIYTACQVKLPTKELFESNLVEVINSEWTDAPYEIAFIYNFDAFDAVLKENHNRAFKPFIPVVYKRFKLSK